MTDNRHKPTPEVDAAIAYFNAEFKKDSWSRRHFDALIERIIYLRTELLSAEHRLADTGIPEDYRNKTPEYLSAYWDGTWLHVDEKKIPHRNNVYRRDPHGTLRETVECPHCAGEWGINPNCNNCHGVGRTVKP